jgi:hypothetical protein
MNHQKSTIDSEEICYNYTDTNHIWGAEADLLYSFIDQILCAHTTKFTSVAYFATCQSLSNMCIMTYYCQIPSGLPTNTLYASLLSPLHVTCPAHLILLDLVTRINIFMRSTEHETPHYAVVIRFRNVTLTLWTVALILSDNLYLLFTLRTTVSLLHANGL